MANKGLRAISCQVTLKVEAGYNPSHTNETLIGYIVLAVRLYSRLFNFRFLSVVSISQLLPKVELCFLLHQEYEQTFHSRKFQFYPQWLRLLF